MRLKFDQNRAKEAGVARRNTDSIKHGLVTVGKGLCEGLVIAGLLTAPAVLSVPKNANAQQVTIARITAEEVQLETPLARLDEATEPFRRGSAVYNERTEHYSNRVIVPGVTFLVTLDPTQKHLSIVFPPELDENSDGPSPGMRGIDLTDFADAVRRASGRELNGRDLGVRLVLERGTFTQEGREISYVTAYVLPEDRQSGQLVCRQGDNGPYLAYSASYYAGGSSGDIAWLRDPTQHLARAGQY